MEINKRGDFVKIFFFSFCYDANNIFLRNIILEKL